MVLQAILAAMATQGSRGSTAVVAALISPIVPRTGGICGSPVQFHTDEHFSHHFLTQCASSITNAFRCLEYMSLLSSLRHFLLVISNSGPNYKVLRTHPSFGLHFQLHIRTGKAFRWIPVYIKHTIKCKTSGVRTCLTLK